jgi:hypothetical protein
MPFEGLSYQDNSDEFYTAEYNNGCNETFRSERQSDAMPLAKTIGQRSYPVKQVVKLRAATPDEIVQRKAELKEQAYVAQWYGVN